MRPETLEALRRARADGRAVARAFTLDGAVDGVVGGDESSGLPGDVRDVALEAIRQNRSLAFEHGGRRWFAQVLNAPLRLAVVGAVHISQPLVRIAQALGYDVTLIDPRGAFATRDRFPGVTLVEDWPDDALETMRPDGRTAVATLTHDPKIDDPALRAALGSEAFYIGALGSRKTHAGRVARLVEAGFGEADIARIHAPIGLDLGGRAPAEIAVAVAAEMTGALYRPKPGR